MRHALVALCQVVHGITPSPLCQRVWFFPTLPQRIICHRQVLRWSGPALGAFVKSGDLVQVEVCAVDFNADPVCDTTLVGFGEETERTKWAVLSCMRSWMERAKGKQT
jgi:hypothetical protein